MSHSFTLNSFASHYLPGVKAFMSEAQQVPGFPVKITPHNHNLLHFILLESFFFSHKEDNRPDPSAADQLLGT
jgi:hypothetical protein